MMTDTHAIDNARAWMDTLRAMVDRLAHAQECDGDTDTCDMSEADILNALEYGPGHVLTESERLDYHDVEEAAQRIQDSILDVSIRSDWQTPGEPLRPSEYLILITTGGPALRIVGDLGDWNAPTDARLEYQDWGTPWTVYDLPHDHEALLLTFAQQFYFGA